MAKKRKKGGAAEKLTIGQKIRSLNIMFPWFKVVAGTMVAMVVVFVIWGVVRHGGTVFGEVEVSENGQGEAQVGTDEMKDGGEIDAASWSTEVKDEGEADAVSRVKGMKPRAYVGSRPTEVEARTLQDKKLIALTFDDGPTLATVRLLDILKEKKVKATFFVIGRMAQGAPEILQREEREGHVVGSHTMGHVNLTTLNAEAIRQDTQEINGVFQGILGRRVGLTRPPYGAINEGVRTGVDQPLVIWTIDPEDWRTKDAMAVRKHVVERAFDGAIVLMHDIYDSTVDAVAGMIDDLRAAGYEFVTVPEMARIRGVQMEKGEVYGSFRP